jgi:large subunit ribosomal protein L10
MSKVVKQMEMDALKRVFQDVHDLVLLSITGLDCTTDNQVRLGLRKKGIRLQVVKNSLLRRVFTELGLSLGSAWEGPTTLAWGTGSIAELSQEIEGLAQKYEKNIKVKTAVADRREVAFDRALKMPTRAEAIGRVVGLALAPARRLASQILGPASAVASQIKSLCETKEDPVAAA